MKISPLPGLRRWRLHKIKHIILLIAIIGLLCVTYPVKFLFARNYFGLQKADLAEIHGAVYKGNCLLLHSIENTDDCEDVAPNQPNTSSLPVRNTSNALREIMDNIEAKKKDIHLPTDEGVETTKTMMIFGKPNQVMIKENISFNSSIYREIPPVYDDLVKITMDTKTRCKDAGTYNAIIAVHTAPSHFENREAFRWLYGDFNQTKPNRYKVIFFIGLVTNPQMQDLLKKENKEHDDLIQGNFIDAYINMTYKAVMVFNYLDSFCKGMRGLFRVDDDVFMNIERVFEHWSQVQQHHPEKTLMCYRLVKDRVCRKGKWAVPQALIPNSNYEFMRCPGYFTAITVDLVHAMNEKVRKMPYFWIDDIVMLGLVPKAISGVFFYPFNKWMAKPKQTKGFENCVQTLGTNCSMWVGITDVKNFKMFYGYISGSIPLQTNK